MAKQWFLIAMIALFLFSGCGGSRQMVTYNDVERTNSVEVLLTTGEKVEGTVVSAQPLELVVLTKNRQKVNIPKSSIRRITRKPPVKDDFGKGISEEEIQMTKTNKNAVIYGIGGGALRLPGSFFVGSAISHNQDEGAATLAGVTLGGTAAGTYLFYKAGQRKDRTDAIEMIRMKRRQKTIKTQKSENEKMTDELKQDLAKEKEKQEKLRKEREELLKKLRTE